MSGKKTHPERVIPQLAERAIIKAKDKNSVFSEYIVLHFRATGNLAPGCDARDLIAWYQINLSKEWVNL